MTRLVNAQRLRAAWRLAITQTYWRLRLRRVGHRAILHRPMMVAGPSFISLGAASAIREGARLEALPNPNGDWLPNLRIGSRVNIEQGVHIVCSCDVAIEDRVSIAPYCVVVDTYHPHDPPDCEPKIGARLPDRPTKVRIGAGTFIGAHSIILPDVEIGEWCMIGAGSVVTRDIPDHSVVAGNPARVIRRYNPETGEWRRTSDGSIEPR